MLYSDEGCSLKMYTTRSVRRSVLKWPHEGVLLLLREFQDTQHEFSLGQKKHAKIWDNIAEAVQAKSELKPTGLQCQQKIIGLKRLYADFKENGSDSWLYYGVMDEIFGNKDYIPAPTIACSSGPEVLKANIHLSSSDDEADLGTSISHVYERNMFVWTHEGIISLLRQYKKYESEFSVGSKLHNRIWDQIAAGICAETNLKVTGVQCLQKLFRLKKAYKSIKENNPSPSSETVSWPYFDIMDEMYDDKDTVPAIASSSGPDPPFALIKTESPSYDNSLMARTAKECKKTWFVWPHEAVLLLLEQYGKAHHEFFRGEKRHSQIWDDIARAIEAVDSTYKVTGVHCQQKMSYMKSMYKSLKRKHPDFDTEHFSWPFFSIMENLFGNRVQDPPVSVRSDALRKHRFSSSSSDDDYDDKPQTAPAKKRKVYAERMPLIDIYEEAELIRLKQERKLQEREERKYKLKKMKMKEMRAMHVEKINMQRAALNILKEILLK